MDETKNFKSSVRKFIYDSGKMTMVAPEDVCSNYDLKPEELSTFLEKGLDNPDKATKTKEDILKDKTDVSIKLG